MPKRKAVTTSGGGDADASPTPKKSKKEARAEAAARARAWHESRNVGGGSDAAAVAAGATSSPSRRATAASASSSTMTSPIFSAGKSKTPVKSSSSTKRHRAPTATATSASSSTPTRNRNSTAGGTTTGNGNDSSTHSTSCSAASEMERSSTTAKKSRRSTGTNASNFQFVAPPPADSSSIQSHSSASHTDSKPSTPEIKKKRKEGREAIQRLRMERQLKGLQDKHSPDHLSLPTATATTTKTTTENTTAARAMDPPPLAAMSSSAVSAASSTERTRTTTTAAAAMARVKPPSPAQHTACRMPPSVASLFSQRSQLLSPSSSKKSTPDPPYKQFDPSQPFPTTGYKLRTAAYCGCGPTPNSNNTVSARGSATANASAASYCINTTRTVPFTTPRVRYSNDGSVGGSEATSEGGDDEEYDERKMPYQRPSPPGQYANQQQQQHHGESLPDAGLLANAILRARGILSSAAAGSQRRREGMGIYGLIKDNESSAIPTYLPSDAHTGGNVVGFPPRNDALLKVTEQAKPTVSATYDGNGGLGNVERPPMDPPVVHSSSTTPYATTLQKFRNATGETNHPFETRVQQPLATAETTTPPGEPNTTVEKTSIHPITSNLESSSVRATSPSHWATMCLSIGKLVLVLVGMAVLFIVANSSSNRHIASSDLISKIDAEVDLGSCFINNLHTMHDVDSDNDPTIHECEGIGNPCPQWGRCQGGKLLDCNDGGEMLEGRHRFVPSVKRDRCVPSPEAIEYVRLVHAVLMRMTSDLICQSGWNDDDTTFPLFSIESVAEKLREIKDDKIPTAAMTSELLQWLSPVFDASLVRFGSLSEENESNSVDALGLGHDVSPNTLPLPMRCRLNLMLWELLGYLFQSSWLLAWFVVRRLFRFTTSYPIYSIGALVFGKMVQYVRRRRKHRAKVRELHGIVLEAVYDRLSECEDHEGYAALILRDDVGHDMYPTNFSQRLFINDYVWPRVSLEIKADNRVRKFRKLTNGKELEHWDFAVQSKRGRRLRKSIGTPVETPGSSIIGGSNSDAVPLKRDP